MPIKIGNKSYKKFANAVKAIQRNKGLSKERAQAYAATIDRAQNKPTKKKGPKKK